MLDFGRYLNHEQKSSKILKENLSALGKVAKKAGW